MVHVPPTSVVGEGEKVKVLSGCNYILAVYI
jgi:hypothetical protein